MKVYCIGLYDNSTQKYAYFPTFTFEKDATNVKISQGAESITLEYSGPENLLNTSQIDIVKKGIIPTVTGSPNTDLQTFVEGINNQQIPFAIFIEFYKNPNSPITGEYTAAQLMLMDGITKNPAKNQKGELICDIHNDVPLEKANVNNKTNLNAINATAIKENGPDQSIKSLKPTILVALKQGAASMKQGMSSMFSNSPVQSSTTAQTTPICTFMKKVIENKKNPAPGPVGGPVSTNTSPVGGLVSTNTGAAPNATVVAVSTNTGPAGGVVNTNTGAAVSNSNSNISAPINQINAASNTASSNPNSLYNYITNVENFKHDDKSIVYDFTNLIIKKDKQVFFGFYFPFSINDINNENLDGNAFLNLLNNFVKDKNNNLIKENESFVILFRQLKYYSDGVKKIIKLQIIPKLVFTEIIPTTPKNITECVLQLNEIIKVNLTLPTIILPLEETVLNGYTVKSATTKGGALKRIAQQTSIPRIYRPVSQRKTDYYNYT